MVVGVLLLVALGDEVPVDVVGLFTRGVVLGAVLVLVGAVVADAGLFAGLVAGLLLGRLVLPPPIVPPPLAGSCWAIPICAVASRHTKTEKEIREKRRVDIRFSPATQTAIEVLAETDELL